MDRYLFLFSQKKPTWRVSREKAWKMCLVVGVCVCVCIYDSAFFQHMILVFLGFFSVINRYVFDLSIDICREPCRHSTSTFADIWIDICAPPYLHQYLAIRWHYHTHVIIWCQLRFQRLYDNLQGVIRPCPFASFCQFGKNEGNKWLEHIELPATLLDYS